MAEISSGSNSSTDLSSAEECVEQAASSYASYFDIEPKKQRQQLGEEIEEMLTKLDEFCAVVDMDCHPDQSTDETQQGLSTQGCHPYQFTDDCQPDPSSQKVQPVLSSYTPKAKPYPVKLECHNSSEDCWYPNESFSTAQRKRKSLMALPERRSSIHHEPDLSSEEVESDLLKDERSPTETLSEAHPRNSKGKDNNKPQKIMQQHSMSPKHLKAKRQKLTSQEVSNPSSDCQAMSKNEPRPPKQESYKKPYRYCIFCGKMASKLSAHILLKHYENPRVQSAAKLPYKERIQEFMKIRKEGILHQNKLEAKKCNPVYKRERSSKNTESVPVMCSICHGFFEKSYIKRHTIRCRRDADTAVHGVDIPASFLQNDNLMAKESEFVTEDMTRFRQSESSQLCRTDPVLLKSGKSIWNDKRKQSKSCDSSDNRRYPTRSSLVKHEPDLSSDEVDSDLRSNDSWNPSPEEIFSVIDLNNSEEDDIKPLKIKQQPSKPPTAVRQKLTSPDAAGVSNPSLDSQAMLKNKPRQPKQETYKKPYRYCIFCGKMSSKLSDHLMKRHRHNLRVQNAVKLPKKERIREFMKIKKEGILHQNKLEAKKCNPVYKRERLSKKTGSIPVMCSICNGFFAERYIEKHTNKCRKNAETAVHGVDIPESFLQNDDLIAKESGFVSDLSTLCKSKCSRLCTADPVLEIEKELWKKEQKKQNQFCNSSDNRRYPTRSSSVKYEPDLSSDEVESDLRSDDGWNPSPEETFSETDLDNSEENYIRPLKIKQEHSKHPKHPTAKRLKLTSPDDAGVRNPSLDSQAVSENEPRQPKQETYKKPYRYCIFCGKMLSKLSDHLIKQHHDNPRVQNAVKLPKKERIQEFNKIRKEGILHQNKLEAKKCNPVYKRERLSKKTESVLVMCSICNGFLEKSYIKKHIRKCRKNAETAVH